VKTSSLLGGKASRRMTLVICCAFFYLVLYMKVGYLPQSVAVARVVPLWGKGLVGILLFASIWYSDWRIQRRVLRPDLAPPRRVLFYWDGLIALTFAVVTADARTAFYICTYTWVVFLFASSYVYGRKWAKVRRSQAKRKAPINH
jgi:hypothetical protein